MKLNEALININAKSNKMEKMTSGHADDIATFWEDVVVPSLPPKDRVVDMFRVLKQYVEDPDAVFAIRTGNTRVKGDPKTLRRGFLTELEGDTRRYFYTDNDLATVVFKLIYNKDWDINYRDFKDTMAARAFPVHFNASCKEEKAKAAVPISFKSPGIGEAGYKVSHIFDTGMNYDFGNKTLGMADIRKAYFPFDGYDDWKMNAKGYYARSVTGALPAEALKFLKAHFLRFACPLNYILTPKIGKKAYQKLGVKLKRNDIGECAELLAYAQEKFKALYGSVYDEYLKLLMLPKKAPIRDPGAFRVDITYGENASGTAVVGAASASKPSSGKSAKSKPVSGAAVAALPASLSKSDAIGMLKANGCTIRKKVSFSSRNGATLDYWQNFDVSFFDEGCTLILNDQVQKKLYLFDIPANAIDSAKIGRKGKKTDVVNLQIKGGDLTFTDKVKGEICFDIFLVAQLGY